MRVAMVPLRVGIGCLVFATMLAFGASPAQAERAARGSTQAVATTRDVQSVARWVRLSHDNRDAPFLIVDKHGARVFVFAADATMTASAPVLLGAARGDQSVPGIGEREMNRIRPYERTTPAGRFVGEAGRNLQGEDVVWVDYDAAVSMHRVRATNPRERRLERLATPTPKDNRISYGCINVPAAFFDAHIQPLFAGGRRTMIYVLPDSLSLRDVFPRVESAD